MIKAVQIQDLVILDTNVLVHLLRGDATGRYVEQKFALAHRPFRPLISSISEGEIRGLARYWSWGATKLAHLDQALARLVRVSAALPEVIAMYGEMFAEQRSTGLPIGENDLWIAASANAANAVLLSCDSDFESVQSETFKFLFIEKQ